MNRTAFLHIFFACALSLASFGCHAEELSEASVNLDLRQFHPLLQATSKLIDSGFGDEQIRRAMTDVHETAVGASRRRDFPITYQGRKTTLRIEFKNDDEDALDVWFFSTPDLAKLIQQRMRELVN